MSDLPQLEQALVHAARRQARRRRRRPIRLTLAAVLAAAAAAAVVALALSALGSDDERSAAPPPRTPSDPLGAALAQTRDDAACRVRSGRGRLSGGEPSAATASAFGALRRSARPGDAYPRAWLNQQGAAGDRILARAVRRLLAADNSTYLLVVTQGAPHNRPADPEACAARRRATFDSLAAGSTAAERREGHFQIDQMLRDDRARGGTEQLSWYTLLPDGAPASSRDAAAWHVRRHGLYDTNLFIRDGATLRSFRGLVPDGVAQVELAGTRVRVQDNVFHVELRGRTPNPIVVRWLGSDGRELRRVAQPIEP